MTALAERSRLPIHVPGYVAALALIALTLAVAPVIGSAARFVFIAGCGLVGLHAWSRGPAEHIQAVLALFMSAPFLRRIVDLGAGFDLSGLMLLGPLLLLLAPLPSLYHQFTGQKASVPLTGPMLTVSGCIAYSTALTLAQGDWMGAASNLIKWIAPIIYAAAILQHAERAGAILRAATRAFALLLPVTGLYGIYQYVDPLAWDRYWLSLAPITSAGLPEAYMVRVFSTMNGPASFATFTATGLVLVYFLQPGWLSRVVVLPAVLALLLSLYRTAWLSLAVSVAFCALFASLRMRALGGIAASAAAILAAVLVTPFGEVISDRLATLGEGTADGSGQERLQQYIDLWRQPDGGLIGSGFVVVDTRTAGAIPIDGMVIACWTSMGIIVGLVCLAALVAAVVRAMAPALRSGGPEAVVLAALAAGSLAQMPLASITSGELGFLFWGFTTLALSLRTRDTGP